MQCYAIEVDAIPEGTHAIWGYGPNQELLM